MGLFTYIFIVSCLAQPVNLRINLLSAQLLSQGVTAGRLEPMNIATVNFLTTGKDVIAAETTLRTSAAEVYALLANPARHAELDGGNSIRGLRKGSDSEFSAGDTFSLNMVLGVPYTLTMKVTRAAKNKGVTWVHPGKHTWAWDIIDHEDGTITVRETFDASKSPLAGLYHLSGAFKRNRKNIALSLANLHRIFAP